MKAKNLGKVSDVSAYGSMHKLPHHFALIATVFQPNPIAIPE